MTHEPPRSMPAPAAMPGFPFAPGGYKLTNKAIGLGAASITAMLNMGWSHETLLREAMIEGVPAAPSLPEAQSMPSPVNEWHITRPLSPSDIAASVVDQVLDRDAHGQRKYGVSLDRTDLDTPDWLQHMAEELLDGAHYALAAKREISRRSEAHHKAVTTAMNSAQDQARQLMSEDDFKVVTRYIRVFWQLYQAELAK